MNGYYNTMTNTPRTWEAHIRTKYGISDDDAVDGLITDISTIEDEAVRREKERIMNQLMLLGLLSGGDDF